MRATTTILLQNQQNGRRTNPHSALVGRMQYITASGKPPGKVLRSLRDKFSLGSTARGPQGGFMKRNLIGTLSLVALSLLLTATGAAAQSAVQANVPFAFRVGTAQLPAGSYRIKAGSQSLIVIGNLQTMKSVYSQAQWEGPSHTSQAGVPSSGQPVLPGRGMGRRG